MLFAHTARLSVFHETGEPLPRYGSGHPEIVPYQAFEAADGWIFVAAWVDRLWLPFCKAVGLDALATDLRFATRQDRLAHRAELEAILAPVFRTRPVARWMETLEEADVLCAPVNDYPGLVRHPQVAATGFITEQDHPRAGRFKTVATPVKLEKTPGTIRSPAPLLGEHSRDVLAEAGFTSDEIESLAARRII
jgi:crotonobetainyl-CoA:carnitine CoA-transferase CaiB-like acyl-CoA transferase